MKEIIATEHIFNAIGQRVGLRYHYVDGTSREVTERSTTSQMSSKLKDVMKKFEKKNGNPQVNPTKLPLSKITKHQKSQKFLYLLPQISPL